VVVFLFLIGYIYINEKDKNAPLTGEAMGNIKDIQRVGTATIKEHTTD
jgi:hypothetical protein